MRLRHEDVRKFATVSGDRNPIHLDRDFARRTSLGYPIAHGALVAITALPMLGEERLRRLRQVTATFHRPIFPDSDYHVVERKDGLGATQLQVKCSGEISVRISVRLGSVSLSSYDSDDSKEDGSLEHARPATLALQHGMARYQQWTNVPYQVRVRELSALAGVLGASEVPAFWLVLFAWSSWLVGMRVPGSDSMLASIKLKITSATQSVDSCSRVRVLSDDARTGSVNLAAQYGTLGRFGEADILAFRRHAVPMPSGKSLANYLVPSAHFRGRDVVVVGGSRGLGAALVGGFASQEATVWPVYASSTDRVNRLRAEFGDDLVRPLKCDATDIWEVRGALNELRSHARELAGLVLCATPPLVDLPVHEDAIERALEHMSLSLRMALVPIATALPLLAKDGWIVFVSTAAAEEPVRGWAHYTAGKVAVEHYCNYLAAHHHRPVLLVRPQMMWTELVNRPAGRLGSRTSTEQVAAGVVQWTMSRQAKQIGVHIHPHPDHDFSGKIV